MSHPLQPVMFACKGSYTPFSAMKTRGSVAAAFSELCASAGAQTDPLRRRSQPKSPPMTVQKPIIASRASQPGVPV